MSATTPVKAMKTLSEQLDALARQDMEIMSQGVLAMHQGGTIDLPGLLVALVKRSVEAESKVKEDYAEVMVNLRVENEDLKDENDNLKNTLLKERAKLCDICLSKAAEFETLALKVFCFCFFPFSAPCIGEPQGAFLFGSDQCHK